MNFENSIICPAHAVGLANKAATNACCWAASVLMPAPYVHNRPPQASPAGAGARLEWFGARCTSSSSTCSGGMSVSHSISVGHRAPAAHGVAVHLPHGLGDAAAVVVDDDVTRVHVPRQVNFGHGHAPQGIQPRAAVGHQGRLQRGIGPGRGAVVVQRVDHEVVHVDQQVAAGAAGQLGQEIGFAPARCRRRRPTGFRRQWGGAGGLARAARWRPWCAGRRASRARAAGRRHAPWQAGQAVGRVQSWRGRSRGPGWCAPPAGPVAPGTNALRTKSSLPIPMLEYFWISSINWR